MTPFDPHDPLDPFIRRGRVPRWLLDRIRDAYPIPPECKADDAVMASLRATGATKGWLDHYGLVEAQNVPGAPYDVFVSEPWDLRRDGLERALAFARETRSRILITIRRWPAMWRLVFSPTDAPDSDDLLSSRTPEHARQQQQHERCNLL